MSELNEHDPEARALELQAANHHLNRLNEDRAKLARELGVPHDEQDIEKYLNENSLYGCSEEIINLIQHVIAFMECDGMLEQMLNSRIARKRRTETWNKLNMLNEWHNKEYPELFDCEEFPKINALNSIAQLKLRALIAKFQKNRETGYVLHDRFIAALVHLFITSNKVIPPALSRCMSTEHLEDARNTYREMQKTKKAQEAIIKHTRDDALCAAVAEDPRLQGAFLNHQAEEILRILNDGIPPAETNIIEESPLSEVQEISLWLDKLLEEYSNIPNFINKIFSLEDGYFHYNKTGRIPLTFVKRR